MIRIAYTAKRALESHAVGDTVTLTFSAAEPLVPRRTVVRDMQRSLGGRRETLFHHGLRSWDITTGPMATTTLDALEEFLTAVEDGSQFDFEVFYEPTSPPSDTDSAENRLRKVPTVRAVLASEQYQLSNIAAEGTGGQDDWYQVSFTVEEAV